MAYVAVEVSCSPKGVEKYPVPTTIKIAKIFASVAEISREFAEDKIIKAESECTGQDVYYLLWKLDTPLNLDRCIQKDNIISNCGMWLPDSQRLYADGANLNVELVPDEKIQQRARERAAAEKAAQRLKKGTRRNVDDYPSEEAEALGDYEHKRRHVSSDGARFSRTNSGTPWNKFA
uniref:Uncharacterized protein n=1 Tax=viral metagenome TaxID=1070528 RepID=A0A6C0IV10_9ZZZZ